MRNRAKCRRCGAIIESMHRHDHVYCDCKEISVDGGDCYWKLSARNYLNFIRLDDEGNEVIEEPTKEKTNKERALQQLNMKIQDYEKLPEQIKWSAVNHVDMQSLFRLIKNLIE